ncbi:nucleobase:cation symporter-2 family protein [Novosphingobium album (ex Liu et al. 2023)]|uniref:Nucleobase:cation symporter-2 family protein n=1 Tax=Novosphingobium album (ex Liu et al. 2023) TaxID=3031130 RepID=A0ABT5WJS4_9SPHN|nr:nucleobase:cation symporter-2 family protein [Novosphingobium album (ex Liu et al. 2023)]MDE8650285.1 nucleobase:cation symporter-2 family protein [Novosphingobium album (ex Liu et al. 2023)]
MTAAPLSSAEAALPGALTPEQARDPDYFPGMAVAIPLGIQHVLAMFVSNMTPAIIVAGAAGFGYGSADTGEMIYMIQMAMLFAGIATLLQTIGFGPIGARLPLVQGTSFAFIPIMIPIVAGKGVEAMAALTTAALFGGLLHAGLSFFVGRIRFALPPMITGLVVLMIGLSLMRIGVQYAAGGVPAVGTPAFGAWQSWLLAGVVVVTTLGLNFFGRGIWSNAAVLLGLAAGYGVALAMGRVSFDPVATAGWVMLPTPFHFGFAVSASAIVGFCLTGFVSSIESIGDVDAICEGSAGRPATDRELSGAVCADGVGTALAAVFGAMPNTTFSQNVGLIAITGVMSRHVVTVGALFLIVCGLAPKIGALITTIPIEVLGGGVIVMFGMVASAATAMLSGVAWTQRNMLIFGVSLSLALGLQLEPEALQHVPETLRILLTSGVLPAACTAVALNLIVPGRTGKARA